VLFTHPAGDYDFVIHLDRAILPRYHQNISPDLSLLTSRKYANASLDNGEDDVKMGLDPAKEFVADLQVFHR
jgi:U3 small nucleolar RNA-associated protein 22